MFCHNCGNKLVDGALFCSICGSRVVIPENNSAPRTPQINIQPPEQVIPMPAPQKMPPEEPAISKENGDSQESCNVIEIQAYDFNLIDRGLEVSVNGTSHKIEKRKGELSFSIKGECKLQAFLDDKKIESDTMTISGGKTVTLTVELDDGGNLHILPISESSNVPAAQRKSKKPIIIGISIFLLVILFVALLAGGAFESSARKTAKSTAEASLLLEAQRYYGEEAKITEISFNSIEEDVFTDLNEYDFYRHLTDYSHTDKNGKEYKSTLAYFEENGMDIDDAVTTAYIMSGEFTIESEYASHNEKYYIILIHLELDDYRCWYTVTCDFGDWSEEAAHNAIRSKIAAKISLSTLGGVDISLVDCSFTTTKKTADKDYLVYGTVTVRNVYGQTYTANFNGTAKYNDNLHKFDTEVSIGGFN